MLSHQVFASELGKVTFLDIQLALNHLDLVVQQVDGGLAAIDWQTCAIFLWNLQARVDGIGNIAANAFAQVEMILG